MTKDTVKEKFRALVAEKLSRGDITTVSKKTKIKYETVWHQMKGNVKPSPKVIDATIELIREKKQAEKGMLAKMEV